MQVNDDYRALDGEREFTGENMKIEWEEGFEIRVSIDSNAVYLSANKEGLQNIPPELHRKYVDIAVMITEFCDEHLDDDYKKLCMKTLKKLCNMPDSPIKSGKVSVWAAGIVYVIAQNTNVVRLRSDIFTGIPKYHLSSDTVCSAFGVSNGGMGNKAKYIRDILGINKEKVEWMLPEWRDSEIRKSLKAMRKLLGVRARR